MLKRRRKRRDFFIQFGGGEVSVSSIVNIDKETNNS
jgi:hypothetical protein